MLSFDYDIVLMMTTLEVKQVLKLDQAVKYAQNLAMTWLIKISFQINLKTSFKLTLQSNDSQGKT